MLSTLGVVPVSGFGELQLLWAQVSAGRLQRVAELFKVPVTSLFGRQQRRAEQTDRTFEFLGEAGAIQLLQAYARIRGSAIRQGLVRLARQIAAGQ